MTVEGEATCWAEVAKMSTKQDPKTEFVYLGHSSHSLSAAIKRGRVQGS